MSIRLFCTMAMTSGIVAAAGARHRIDYRTKGAIEVDTNENSLFLWRGSIFVLENIPCYYSQHYGRWNETFANNSYTRIRRMDNGTIVTNVTNTIGYGFVSAFVDEDFDKVWFFGSKCNRCPHPNAGPQGCEKERKVSAWYSTDTNLLQWSNVVEVEGTVPTFNVEVARVRSTPAKQKLEGLPTHRYIMILEIENRFMFNNRIDGDLTQSWKPIPGAVNPNENGGPSIRYNSNDGFYYAILGGHTVGLHRTRNFSVWETSPNAPFIQSTAADAQISGLAGFDIQVAAQRNFFPMMGPDNFTRWDWNSNDADVCCMTNDPDHVHKSWVVWGAGTQGAAPKPPLTRANHCANIIAEANISLSALLAAHFDP